MDLNCVLAGQTQATIMWYKRGGRLPARHQVQTGTVAVGTLWSWVVSLQGLPRAPHTQDTQAFWTQCVPAMGTRWPSAPSLSSPFPRSTAPACDCTSCPWLTPESTCVGPTTTSTPRRPPSRSPSLPAPAAPPVSLRKTLVPGEGRGDPVGLCTSRVDRAGYSGLLASFSASVNRDINYSVFIELYCLI